MNDSAMTIAAMMVKDPVCGCGGNFHWHGKSTAERALFSQRYGI